MWSEGEAFVLGGAKIRAWTMTGRLVRIKTGTGARI